MVLKKFNDHTKKSEELSKYNIDGNFVNKVNPDCYILLDKEERFEFVIKDIECALKSLDGISLRDKYLNTKTMRNIYLIEYHSKKNRFGKALVFNKL